MDLTLRRYFYRSAIAHLIAFTFLVASPYLPFNRFHFGQEKILWVELPRGKTGTLGVGLKKSEGLPKTTIQEQKKIPVIPEAPKKPSMTYQKTTEQAKREGTQKSAEEKRIEEALARVEKTEKEAARKQATAEAAQIPAGQEGGVPLGTATNAKVSPNDLEYILYQTKIRQRIMEQWILPSKYTDPGLGLICKIVVHINDQGEVVETGWEQQSGNPSFDMSALRAVEKASPLDIPPERLKYEVLNEGFIVEFNPKAKP